MKELYINTTLGKICVAIEGSLDNK